MDSTNAQDQEQVTRGEYHGQGSSLMRKLSHLFPLAILMALNGSIFLFDSIIFISLHNFIFVYKYKLLHFHSAFHLSHFLLFTESQLVSHY